jgi:FKBP-type peptidyl-prolyl cis-trans isomerase
MKKIFVFALMIVAIVACNKTADPPLTADEIYTRDQAGIDEYLASNGITNAIMHKSGVRYVIKNEGTGPKPTHQNCVRVRYSGYFLNDPVPFDSNQEDGHKFAMVNIVAGMEIVVKMLGVGGKADIYVPSALGYGASGVRDATGTYVIPPNSVLVFKDVELMQIYDYNNLGGYCYE